MHTRQLKNEEIALLLEGLRSIYVEEHEEARQKLIESLEGALAARGLASHGLAFE